MPLGEYITIAGTLVGVFFKSATGQQASAFLVQLGTAMEAGVGSVGPIRAGNDGVTVTIAPWVNPAA